MSSPSHPIEPVQPIKPLVKHSSEPPAQRPTVPPLVPPIQRPTVPPLSRVRAVVREPPSTCPATEAAGTTTPSRRSERHWRRRYHARPCH